VWVLVTPHF
jgi:hypothetical protein